MGDYARMDGAAEKVVTVNGERLTVSPGTLTVADLLDSLGVVPGRVAVEINLVVIDPGQFQATALHGGDRVEIVGFVGGGNG